MINPEGPITIDTDSLASGSAYKATAFILSAQYWHKVIVFNVESDSRELVLSTLMEAARPHDFIPVNYTVHDDKTVTFLLKNSGQALMQFCSMHLIVSHPIDKNRLPYKLKLSLCEMLSSQFTICMKPLIVKILRRRHDKFKKKLNLDLFHLDPELTEFFHLSQTKLLYFVLHLSRDLEIETLILSNNNIESLHPFEAMCNEKCLKGLTAVDLSNNKIKSLEELTYLKQLPINSINLDGNPCCNDFKDLQYLKSVTKYLPAVTKLDGCFVSKLGLPPCRRNYICTQSGHELVDTFLEHYFCLYDSNLRSLLSGMYHKEAMFSISQKFLPDQLSSKTTKIIVYRKYSRNLKTLMDLSKSNLMMFVGTDMIANILTSLPATEHDPNTFTVDVTKFEGSLLAITVTGVYKHVESVKFANDMYNFMRTFLLIRQKDDEYKIINDIINVSNVTTLNESVAFRVNKEPDVNYINVPLAKSLGEMGEMVETMVIITHLKKEWAKKCLQECKYDFKKALNLFVNLYKQDKLPMLAFYSDEETMIRTITPEETTQENKIPKKNKECLDDRIRTDNATAEKLNTDEVKSALPFRYTTEDVEKISDEYIKRIALIDSRTTDTETRKILTDAAKSVLGNYKNPWHYCYVGLHMYKNGYVEEARKLIAKSEFILTPERFQKLNMDFLLFEIEYGDSRHVDSLMRRKILMDSVDPVLEFVLNHVPSISRGMTRSLFRRMTEYKLPITDIRKIITAFKKFELVYGTAETLEQAIKMEEKHFPSRKRSFSKSPSKTTQKTTEFAKNNPQLAKKPARNENTFDAVSSPEAVDLGGQDSCSEISRSPECSAEKLKEKFEDFTLKVLKLLGVHIDRIDDPSVKAIEDFHGDNKTLISMCDAAFNTFKNRYAIVAVIYKKYWERNMVSSIRDLLAKSKDFTEKGLVNNLIVLFKIRMQLQQRNQSETLQKINMHVNKISFEDTINFFETLSQEKGDDVSKIFESCLENESIDEKIKRVIILKYKAYCIKNGLEFVKYNDNLKLYGFFKSAANDDLFNFEQMLDSMNKLPDPINLPLNTFALAYSVRWEQVRNAAFKYLKTHQYKLLNCVHLVRFLLLKQFKDVAHQIIAQCNKVLTATKGFHFALMTSLLFPNFWKSTKKVEEWKDQFETNVNYVGTLAEIYLTKGSTQLARNVIVNYLKNTIILDVEVQKRLFQYFESWKMKFRIDMLSVALTVMDEDAPAKDNHSLQEEVLISSGEDSNF